MQTCQRIRDGSLNLTNIYEDETKEADIVSARIAKILGEKTFQFSPAEVISIHRRLFEGVFEHAGQIRNYNITKKEWVLKGETVIYASWNMHVDYVKQESDVSQSVISKGSKFQFDSLECTLEELAILNLIIENNSIKQNELVKRTGKSLSTVKRMMEALQKKKCIRRVNGKRYGKWEVLVDISV